LTHEEVCGPKPLIEIYRHHGAGSDKVVRWCPKCGAVVIDEDYDGRIRPGFYLPMKFTTHMQEKLRGQVLDVLSDREKQIFFRLASGLSVKDIASELSLSPKTGEAHRHNIYKKLREYGVTNISQLTRFAIKQGVIGA
jgi:DNA-binding NarL/FixJ family response regulator